MEKKKVIIVFGVLIAIVLLLMIIDNKNLSNSKIKNNFEELGFVAEEGSLLYEKQISEIDINEYLEKVDKKENAIYEVLYFNQNDSQLIKNKMSNEDGMEITFIPTYDYLNKELTYTYRIVYDNANIMFEGKYNIKNSKFTCENIYTYEFDIEAGQEYICNKIKYDIEDFYQEVQELSGN